MSAKDSTADAIQARLYDIRRTRLRQLMDQYDQMTDFAEAIGESLNYTSRLVSLRKKGRKNLGEGKARKIEGQLGLPRGWLDRDTDAAEVPPLSRPGWPFSPARFPRALWDALSPAEQRKAESMFALIVGGIESERAPREDVG